MKQFLLGLCLSATACAGLALAAPAPQTIWSVSVGQQVYNPPQASGGKLFLTSMQPAGPNVFAISGASGKLLWSYATQGAVGIPPTVSATQLFVASDIGNTHFLRAIDTHTGFLIWQYTRDQPPECMCSQASILSGGLLFAQSDGHSLYAFAPSGSAPSKRLWQFAGDGAALSSPVVADGLVLFGSGDHNLYALDAKTGQVRWTGSSGYIFTAAPLVAGGVAVIGDQGGNIDGFDLHTGKQLWSDSASAAIDNAAVAANGTAYLVSEDHNVYAITISNGNQPWTYTMDDYSEFSPVLAGKSLIVANRAGEILALDAGSGKLLWQSALGGVPFSAPVYLASEHAVVLKVNDHDIAAFSAASGKPLWRYTTPDVVTEPVVNNGNIDLATNTGTILALH